MWLRPLLLLLPSVVWAINYKCQNDQVLVVQSFGNDTIRMHCQRLDLCGYQKLRCDYDEHQPNCGGQMNFVAHVHQSVATSPVEHTCCNLFNPRPPHMVTTHAGNDCFIYELPDGSSVARPKEEAGSEPPLTVLKSAAEIPEHIDGISGYRLRLFLLKNKAPPTLLVKGIERRLEGYRVTICRPRCTSVAAAGQEREARAGSDDASEWKAISWSSWTSTSWTTWARSASGNSATRVRTREEVGSDKGVTGSTGTNGGNTVNVDVDASGNNNNQWSEGRGGFDRVTINGGERPGDRPGNINITIHTQGSNGGNQGVPSVVANAKSETHIHNHGNDGNGGSSRGAGDGDSGTGGNKGAHGKGGSGNGENVSEEGGDKDGKNGKGGKNERGPGTDIHGDGEGQVTGVDQRVSRRPTINGGNSIGTGSGSGEDGNSNGPNGGNNSQGKGGNGDNENGITGEPDNRGENDGADKNGGKEGRGGNGGHGTNDNTGNGGDGKNDSDKKKDGNGKNGGDGKDEGNGGGNGDDKNNGGGNGGQNGGPGAGTQNGNITGGPGASENTGGINGDKDNSSFGNGNGGNGKNGGNGDKNGVNGENGGNGSTSGNGTNGNGGKNKPSEGGAAGNGGAGGKEGDGGSGTTDGNGGNGGNAGGNGGSGGRGGKDGVEDADLTQNGGNVKDGSNGVVGKAGPSPAGGNGAHGVNGGHSGNRANGPDGANGPNGNEAGANGTNGSDGDKGKSGVAGAAGSFGKPAVSGGNGEDGVTVQITDTGKQNPSTTSSSEEQRRQPNSSEENTTPAAGGAGAKGPIGKNEGEAAKERKENEEDDGSGNGAGIITGKEGKEEGLLTGDGKDVAGKTTGKSDGVDTTGSKVTPVAKPAGDTTEQHAQLPNAKQPHGPTFKHDGISPLVARVPYARQGTPPAGQHAVAQAAAPAADPAPAAPAADVPGGAGAAGGAAGAPPAAPAAPAADPPALMAAMQKMNCFAADSLVTTVTGKKRMDQLQVGDFVLVPSAGNVLKYERVEMFYHREPKTRAQFVVLITENKRRMALTPLHLLPFGKCSDIKSSLKSAEGVETMLGASRFAYNAKVGECVLSLNDNGELIADKIVKVGRQLSEGIYSPMTVEGALLVDGVLASCFSQLESHSVQKTVFDFLMFVNDIFGIGYGRPVEQQSVPSFVGYVHSLSQYILPFAKY